jgi:tryptophan halogenase
MSKKITNDIYNVDSVTILGGGTAGWLTALALTARCPRIEITLIQPPEFPPIGVGESTQPDLIELLIRANIPIEEFVYECDATPKCGIYYEDWHEKGTHFWHPFANIGEGKSTYSIAHHYQVMINKHPDKYTHQDYYDAVHQSYDICVKNKKIDRKLPFAFHVDADKLHKFLRKKLTNVEVIEAKKIEVVSEDNEKILYINCDDVNIVSDLYIDCTGFNRVLMKELNNVDENAKEYYHENVDSAIFARVPYQDKEKEIVPYTKAHAQEHGWIWTIPLASRIGTGYVYTANTCKPEDAEQQFREYWGIERMKDIEVRHLKFNSDSLKQPWKGNVVAIGLSSGFVEPLEATGINWIITASNYLASLLCRRYYDRNIIESYNSGMQNYITDVQDFIDVHYKLSKRKDSRFWEYHTTRNYHPRLNRKLEIYKKEFPAKFNRPTNLPWAFTEISWLDILNGYEFKYDHQEIDDKSIAAMQKELARLRALKVGRLDVCVTPLEMLKEMKELYDLRNNKRLA